MAKRCRELYSDDTAAEMAEFETVFVDTSLDTHLAMLVSSSDTVSEFKKKIMLEHKQCFPTIGEILIHSLKVKRRSNFYHLPDIMLVWSAFHGVKQNWFLSADASKAHTYIKPSCEFDTNNSVKMGLTNLCDDCRGLSSDVNRIQTLPIPSPGGASEKNVMSEMVTEFIVNKTTDLQSYLCSEEYCIGTDSRPKKKCKVGNVEDTFHSPRSEDDCNLLEASCKDILKREVVSSRNVMVDAVRKSPGDGIPQEQSGKGNYHFDSNDRVEFKGQSLPSSTQNPLASGESKEENASDSKMGHELARDAQTDCLEGIYVNLSDHSARMMDASGGVREVNADGCKMKKKQLQKTAREVQDATEMEQTGIGESKKLYSETHESEKKEEGEGMSLEHGHEVMMLSNSKTSDHVDPEPTMKEASILHDANAITKPEISSGTKKKRKREKKSFNTKQEQSGIGQVSNDTSALCPLSTDGMPGETGHKEGISNHEGKEVQLLFDSFIVDVVAEVQGVNRIEGVTEILTQAEQTSTEVRSGKKIADRMAQSSAGNCHADLPALETGNPIMEFNQLEKSSKNIKNKDRKASKRIKNQKLTVSQVQEDLSAEDQRVGNRELATKEASISFANSEQEYRHVDSSMVLSIKTEQKLNEADTGHKEGITNHEGKDIQLRFDAVAEVQGVNRIEGDSVILTQAEQNFAEVRSGNKSAERMAQSSAGSSRADLPALETGNPIMEFNQVDKSKMNTENKDRKASKRRKNQKLTVSQVQEDSSVANRVGNRELATKEASISFANSEQEYRHVDSSMVPSTKTEQKLNEADTGHKEGITNNEGKDIQLRFDAVAEVQGINRIEGDSVILTQAEQNFVEVRSGNKSADRMAQSSAGSSRADLPALETGNPIMEFNQVDKSKMNTENKDRKASKRRKNQKLTVSQVQEDSSVENRVGNRALATKAASISFANSEQEYRHVDSSMVPSTKTEQKLNEANTGHKEGISNHEGKDIQMRFDAVAEVQGVNRIEGDSVILTQTEQNFAEVRSGNKSAERMAQSSAGSSRADLPALETGNPIMESNQVDKSKMNTENKDKKASKRRKNQMLTVSQVQEDSSVANRVGNRELATKEASISFANSEQEYRHVDSSMVPSTKTEQKLNEADTGHKEGITNNEGKDIQLRFDAVAEVQGINRIEGDSVILTQAEQNFAEVRSGNKSAGRMAQSSAGSSRADLPALETGNPLMEFNQVDKSKMNTENKDRKASKRRKNQKLTVSHVQEDSSVDNRVGNRELATKEASISFANSEQEYRHVGSSMVPSTKTEQKLNEAHGIALNTYNLVETSEKEGERINFKQYFVLGQYKDKVESGVKVNKATESNQEMETSKSIKANVAPYVSNSTELQSSIKSNEKNKTENKSCRKGVRSKEDSAQSSDRNEITTDSFKRPSGASGKRAKNSRSSEMCKATLQNPDEGLAAISSHLNKKICRSSDKLSSGRSEILPGKKGNKNFKLDMDATSLMLMKTPQKKSLFTKPGGIFQDDSEESSGDENGTIHLDGNTLSPSDSSSMSGHSVEESGVSMDSTRNGYGNAEGKSTGRRNMSKFGLSELKDGITMDMILKSSKRFRKAKLLASQNEEEDKS